MLVSAPVAAAIPTVHQVRTTGAIVAWYLRTHFGSKHDPGTAAMFCDRKKVGAFAVNATELRRGDAAALFRVLVAIAMFQRLQDILVLKILRGINPSDAVELTDHESLLAFVDQRRCDLLSDTTVLHGSCDLTKDNGKGICRVAPETECHLKRHTVLLKRYGHFGKMPTSIALVLREAKVQDLNELRAQVLNRYSDPTERAQQLEAELSRAWRISSKIAAMFLSLVTNPDLGPAPWAEGVDWTYFVVVDSNVDLFLSQLGYRGQATYAARRAFVTAIARNIDLRQFDSRISESFNPRIVQQAMYLFMSAANRRALEGDCTNVPGACSRCPRALARLCPTRRTER